MSVTRSSLLANSAPKPTPRRFPIQGTLPWIAALLVLLFVTVKNVQNVGYSWGYLLTFLSGGIELIPDGSQEGILQTVFNVGILIGFEATFFIVALMLFAKFVDLSSLKLYDLDEMLDKGAFYMFTMVFIEELFARQLFLGWLAPMFHSPIAFYILLVIGNSIWAVFHLVNYSESSQRSLFFILPQFIGGLILSYIFVRYGFFITVMAHLSYNAIVLSVRKEQWSPRLHLQSITFHSLVGLFSLILLQSRGHSLSDLSYWLNDDRMITALPGYTFWDYALLFFVVESIIMFIGDILWLDYSELSEDSIHPFVFIAGAFLVVGIISLVVFGASFFSSDVVSQTFIATVIISMLTRSRSGSSLARAVFLSVPTTFLYIAFFNLYGWWQAALMIMLSYFVLNLLSLYFRMGAQKRGEM